MVEEPTQLWEILVPCNRNDGKPIRTKHHQEWDKQIQRIAGGLTIMKPAKGKWVSPDGELFKDRMIPVRVACTRKQLDEVIRRTLNHYNDQEAVMCYLIAEEVKIVYR